MDQDKSDNVALPEDNFDESRGARPRRPTEKGRQFTKDNIEKKLNSLIRQLNRIIAQIKRHQDNNEDNEVQEMYKQWLSTYEEYLKQRQAHKLTLTSADEDNFEESDTDYTSFKSDMEQWFCESFMQINPNDSASQINRGSRVGSRLSQLSTASARLKQEQQKAEIKLKMQALQKKREIQLARLKLQMEEGQFVLDTELAITEAKTRLIDDFEDVDKSSVKGNSAIRAQPLRVSAPAFVPRSENYSAQPRLNDNQHINDVVRHLKKPTIEFDKFSGDPLQYNRFLRQFNSNIVKNTENDEERLNFLEQYTAGEAGRIVKGYSYLDASSGYASALKELKERYGDSHVIATAFVNQALNWPQLKPESTKALDNYGIFLAECANAVQSIEAVRVLEYPDNLKKLVSKLPYFFHDKWRSLALQRRNNGEQMTFSDLVSFVKTEAKKANDPLYGRDALRIDSKQNFQKPTQRPKSSFATNINMEPKSTVKPEQPKFNRTSFSLPCMYCDSPCHNLSECENLSELPFEEKSTFLKSKRVCFGCLKFGHMKKDCKNKATCRYCTGRHPSVCHTNNKTGEYSSQDARHGFTSASANLAYGTCNDMRAGDVDCTMAIIPVNVRMCNGGNSIQTYAFLDPGSGASFCTESLLKKVGGSGKPMKITLDTLGSPHTMLTYTVNGLQVGDLGETHWLSLPKIYTKEALPVSTADIQQTTEDIKHWPHFKDVNLPQIHAEIGLLIGNNVPDAYSPTSNSHWSQW